MRFSCKAVAFLLALSLSAASPELGPRGLRGERRELFLSNVAESLAEGLENLKDGAIDLLKDGLIMGIDNFFGSVEVKVPRTDVKYDAENYFGDMADFLLAAVQPDNGRAMQEWYLEGTGETTNKAGVERVGPGPNTITKMGFEDVKTTCEGMSKKIESGLLERRNELGMQYLAPDTWPEFKGQEYQGIGLGQTNDNHAFVRPLLAATLDNGLSTTGYCDGSTCWNPAYLKRRAEAFFNGRTEFKSSDVKWFVTQILHKVHLNVDLNDADAKEFAEYMSKMIILIPFPKNVLENNLIKPLLKPYDTIGKKAVYLNEYKQAIREKYKDEYWVNDEERVTLLASVYLDSLQFAGGLSVPTVISLVMGLTHMSESNKFPHLKEKGVDASTPWVLWETLRKYAPVAGVPFWERPNAGDSLRHVIPNVAQALMDSSVFSEPLEFRNRGLSHYIKTMRDTTTAHAGMGWAGPAIAADHDTANPNSHNCPAQKLSFKIMETFLTAFVESNRKNGGWSAIKPDEISVNANGISTFTLLKKGTIKTTGCNYFPKCSEGYEWKSTKWCWWGRRSWTCVVR